MILQRMFSDNPTMAFQFRQYVGSKGDGKNNVVDINIKQSAIDDYGEF